MVRGERNGEENRALLRWTHSHIAHGQKAKRRGIVTHILLLSLLLPFLCARSLSPELAILAAHFGASQVQSNLPPAEDGQQLVPVVALSQKFLGQAKGRM